MSEIDIDGAEIEKWDPGVTKVVVGLLRPIVKRYFRSEVHGLELLPPGGALVVSNHSGGQFARWIGPTFAVDFYDKFGYDRPIYALTHDVLFHGPTAELLLRIGCIHATRDNAAKALRAGAVVLVFPGGDYDAYRPTLSENVIDFDGHTGYARTAIDAGVPIVPAVSIGGQENQFYLSRGTGLAQALRLTSCGTRSGSNDSADHVRFPVRAEHRGAGQHAAAHQDRHPGARADRHRRAVR